MKTTTQIASAITLGFAAAAAAAQSPSSAFDRGASLQARQDPGLPALLQTCRTPPPIPPARGGSSAEAAPPPPPALPTSSGIPGVIADGATWEVVWAWEGNNADGIIAGDGGTMLFANNDASNVMRLDPATGLATIVHEDTNTGGALSRSSNGALFLASRGLNGGIIQLEPERKMFANSFNGEPLECTGGTLNDLMADSLGGVYVTISGGGLFYADRTGTVTQYGEGMTGVNGIILSPDERTLYVTNGPVLVAFDVRPDGALTNQRDFAELGGGGDGSAVDQEGRIYVAAGGSVDVISPDGDRLGTIPGPNGLHGVGFGGPDRKTLYGIVFYGGWGTPSARNQVVAIPMIAQGYTGRAK